MVGLSEMVGSMHAAVLCALVPSTLQAALSDPEDPNWVLAWILFFVVLAGGLATTIHGNCIFGLVLFYLLCWFPLLRTFKKHHAEMGGDGLRAMQRLVVFFVGGEEGGIQLSQQLEQAQARAHAPICVAGMFGVVAAVVVVAVVVHRRPRRWGWIGGFGALRAQAGVYDGTNIEHAIDQEAVAAPAQQLEQQASLTQTLLPPSEDARSRTGGDRSLERLHDDRETENPGMMHATDLHTHESDILL